MSKMFHIHEEDLGSLEQMLPQLAEALMPVMDNRLRVKLRRCQSILSQVRWDYGPLRDIGIIPADDDAGQVSS